MIRLNAAKIIYEYYHGYTKLDKEGNEPLQPYGFGLSYTSFDVSKPAFMVENDSIKATCRVENTGDRKGTEVVQLYVGYSESKIDRPVKVLRGFERVTLQPGEEKTVTITCPIEKIKWFNPETGLWELEEMDYEVYIGTSSDCRDLLKGKVHLPFQAQ